MQRRYKIPPDKRFIRDARMLLGWYLGEIDDIEMLLQELLAGKLCRLMVVKDMKCIIILIFRIDTISCKSAAQPVGTVMHRGNRFYNRASVHPFSFFGKHSGNCASRRDSYLAFSWLHHFFHLFPIHFYIRYDTLQKTPVNRKMKYFYYFLHFMFRFMD